MTGTSATEPAAAAPTDFTVLCCRPAPMQTSGPSAASGPLPDSGGPDLSERQADSRKTTAELDQMLAACVGAETHFVGRRPGKAIDGLLAGRLLVIGDDADLAAVALRLQRKELLGSVEVAYAPAGRTTVVDLWRLPHGVRAIPFAAAGSVDCVVDEVPLVRDDVGGVLVGVGYLGPVTGTVYVDEHRVLHGAAQRLRVTPDRAKGLAVTVSRRRFIGLGPRPITTPGRAVQIGCAPTTVLRDGIAYDRQMDRWTFYKHTEPLRLLRGPA